MVDHQYSKHQGKGRFQVNLLLIVWNLHYLYHCLMTGVCGKPASCLVESSPFKTNEVNKEIWIMIFAYQFWINLTALDVRNGHCERSYTEAVSCAAKLSLTPDSFLDPIRRA